jgi:hypothetical protein
MKVLHRWRRGRVAGRGVEHPQPQGPLVTDADQPLLQGDSSARPSHRRRGGIIVPARPVRDPTLGLDAPRSLLTEEEKLQLDRDISQLRRRRQTANAKSTGIRLS